MILSEAERKQVVSNALFSAQLDARSARAAATQPQRDALVAQMRQLQAEYDQVIAVKQRELVELSQAYEARYAALKASLDRLL